MKTINFFIVAACCAVLTLLNCTGSVQIAGGASGTEVSGCVVYGNVTDSSGNSIAESIIRLRPYNYVAGYDTGSLIVKRNVYSQTDGKFHIDSIPAGHYSIEVISPDSTIGQSLDCIIDSGDSFSVLPAVILRTMAAIIGNNMRAKSDSQKESSVRALGFERSTVMDSSGYFKLVVPPGWCRLNFRNIDSDISNIDTLIYLQPGQQIVLSRLSSDSQANVNVNKDTVNDISVVRKILDANDFYNIAVESVSVIESGHIVELRLRGMGLQSISSDIGHLKELRVLDIGENSLKELPSSISNLTKLKTLVADSNELWVVPASFGILKSLETLDISANILQSLPEPLTYLEPVALLKLDGNMLCNLGGLTVLWADKYDPGWKDLQVCQKHEIVLK